MVPSSLLALGLDAHFDALFLFEQVQSQVSGYRQIAVDVARSDPVPVLIEGHVQDPMQAVFDPPVLPGCFQERRGRGRMAADVLAGLLRRPGAQVSLIADPGHTAQADPLPAGGPRMKVPPGPLSPGTLAVPACRTVVKMVDFSNTLASVFPEEAVLAAPPSQQYKTAPPGNLTREHRSGPRSSHPARISTHDSLNRIGSASLLPQPMMRCKRRSQLSRDQRPSTSTRASHPSLQVR